MNYIWLCILLSIISKKAAFAKSSTLEMPCTHVIEHNSQDGFGSNLGKLVVNQFCVVQNAKMLNTCLIMLILECISLQGLSVYMFLPKHFHIFVTNDN